MDIQPYSIEKLIELVKRQPAVWCKDDSLYHNRIADKTIWKEISDLLEVDVHILKKKWHALRGQYRREVRKYGVKSKWRYFKRLGFLDESSDPTPSPLSARKVVRAGDPIKIQLDSTPEQDVLVKEESCDWSSNTSVSSSGKERETEKPTPKVPVVDMSNESNHYFALSLVDILNAIPKRNELAARIAVLNALKDFQSAHTETVQEENFQY